MNRVANTIKLLRETNGTNDKIKILKDNKDNELLQKVLLYTYNPYMKYGMSEKSIKIDNMATFNIDIFELLDMLASSNINDSLRATTNSFLGQFEEDECDLYKCMLLKDLRCNISAKTINKVWKGLIPTWEIQQGKPIENAPLKDGESFILSTKLNGVNCSYYKGNLLSRQGQEFKNLSHITYQIKKLGLENYFINGELVRKNDGSISNDENFRISTGIINSDSENKEEIDLIIFDLLPIEEFDNGKSKDKYSDRVLHMESLKKEIKSKVANNIDIVRFYYKGKDQTVIEKYLDEATNNDEEGLMCISSNSYYIRKRSSNVKKVKKWFSADLVIKGYEEGTGKYQGVLGSFIVDYKGFNLSVGSGYSDIQRKEFWENKEDYIGKILEIRYKGESCDKKTKALSVQFGTFQGIRFDKEDPSYN